LPVHAPSCPGTSSAAAARPVVPTWAPVDALIRPRVAADAARVLVVGPSPEMVGGMASVVGQMLELDLGPEYRLELLPFTHAANECETLPGKLRRHLEHGDALRRRLRAQPAAVVHLHTCSGFTFWRSLLDLRVAQGCGARVVLHVHGAAFDSFHAAAGAAARALIRWGMTRADAVVALSESWRAKLHAMAPRARITVVENAVELPPAVPRRYDGQSCRFLLLAKMDTWKGIDDLLDACTLIPAGISFGLTLAGPPGSAGDAGTLAAKIRRRHLQQRVRYVGPVQGRAKDGLFAEVDVYVQPSHHEGMPLALLEALAWGLPVVATRVGAVPEVLTEEREGLLVPPQEPELLGRTMARLATDGQLRSACSAAARRLAEDRFSLRRFRQDLRALYDALGSGALPGTRVCPVG